MPKKNKFSIVVAVYNRPEEMYELLDSIVTQEFKDLEIIVVDDGSEKSSREVVDSFKKNIKIKYFFIENRGPALARNYGVNKSEGEWIIFFDSDCTIPKNYFFEVNKFLEKNKIDFFGGPDMMNKNFTYLQKSITSNAIACKVTQNTLVTWNLC